MIRRQQNQSGFTLLETVVALVLLTFLLTLSGGIVRSVWFSTDANTQLRAIRLADNVMRELYEADYGIGIANAFECPADNDNMPCYATADLPPLARGEYQYLWDYKALDGDIAADEAVYPWKPDIAPGAGGAITAPTPAAADGPQANPSTMEDLGFTVIVAITELDLADCTAQLALASNGVDCSEYFADYDEAGAEFERGLPSLVRMDVTVQLHQQTITSLTGYRSAPL